jgi:hypothetical protein
VFVKELVPRYAIAWVARRVYGENYVALRMRHAVSSLESGSGTAAYEWRRLGAWEGLRVGVSGEPAVPEEDSEEAFITEHYWGYARQPDGGTLEYQVEHPRWRVWRGTEASLDCDAGSLYGEEIAGALSRKPSTAFLAEGSAVLVRQGRRLLSGGGVLASAGVTPC